MAFKLTAIEELIVVPDIEETIIHFKIRIFADEFSTPIDDTLSIHIKPHQKKVGFRPLIKEFERANPPQDYWTTLKP